MAIGKKAPFRLVSDQNLPLTSAAEKAVEEKTRLFRESILRSSMTGAAMNGLDMVSEVHVNRASEGISGSAGKGRRALSAIGGVFAGSSLSVLLSMMVFGNSIGVGVGGFLLLVFVVGCVLLLFDGVRK